MSNNNLTETDQQLIEYLMDGNNHYDMATLVIDLMKQIPGQYEALYTEAVQVTINDLVETGQVIVDDDQTVHRVN